jgi:hypothetical protein
MSAFGGLRVSNWTRSNLNGPQFNSIPIEVTFTVGDEHGKLVVGASGSMASF